jgi:hypothetical protein
MGIPSEPQLPAYQAHPFMDDARTTLDDAPELFSGAETLALPPPYRDVESPDADTDTDAETLVANQTLNDEQYQFALPEDAVIKRKDGTGVIIGGFENDPSYLEWSLYRWASEPPAKMVRIWGTHTEKTKKLDKTEILTITDFDVKLRLTEYLFTHPGRSAWKEIKTVENSQPTYRGTVFKTLDKPSAWDVERAKPSLREWCHRYVANSSGLKV